MVVGLLAASAAAQWSDSFDSYPCNTALNNVGGWKGWDNNPAVVAYTRCAPSPVRSVPNSLEIGRPGVDTDCVHEYSGYTSGRWSYRAWQYIPSKMNGKTYFVLLHTYEDGGPKGWAVQVWFDKPTGKVHVDYTCPPYPIDGDIVFDQWIEIRADIDFDNDRYDFWYNGVRLMKGKRWTEFFCGSHGALNLAAMDLYANSSYYTYYDDIELVKTTGACCDETTGACHDSVYAGDCTQITERFVPFTKCADLQPPCGQGVGACCFYRPDCAMPCFEGTYALCKAQNGDWLGAETTCLEDCCCIVCRAGLEGDPEGEPLCGPDYNDTYNGGCLNNPPAPKAIEMFKVGQNARGGVVGRVPGRDRPLRQLRAAQLPVALPARRQVHGPVQVRRLLHLPGQG
jgi:hypothetical protein